MISLFTTHESNDNNLLNEMNNSEMDMNNKIFRTGCWVNETFIIGYEYKYIIRHK